MRSFSCVRLVLLCAGLSVLCFHPALHAATILSENFNELAEQLGATSAGAFTTINGTNVDIVGSSFNLCNGPESGLCVDMNGTGGDPQGQLQSNMVFVPGNYVLSFDLIGSQRGNTASATVTFGNYDQTFTLASNDLTSGIVTNTPVTVATAGHLLFASDIPGNIGLVLDNVVVSTPSNAIPEPSIMFLMIFGLVPGVLWSICTRRRSRLRA